MQSAYRYLSKLATNFAFRHEAVIRNGCSFYLGVAEGIRLICRIDYVYLLSYDMPWERKLSVYRVNLERCNESIKDNL